MLSGLSAARVLPRKVCRASLALPIIQIIPGSIFPSLTLCQSQEWVCFQKKMGDMKWQPCLCSDQGPSSMSQSGPVMVASRGRCGTPLTTAGELCPAPHTSAVSDPGLFICRVTRLSPFPFSLLAPISSLSLKPCRMLQ